VASDADRQVLTKVGDRELLDVSFAESREEAWDAMNRLVAPVILFDRDWPGADWRATVQAFASSPHQVCVILLSGVADDYLWQELIRCRGYDILTKPLRAGDVERVIKLALSFWKASGSALKHR
jgi:DNA-binding NtrC family response regulator